MPTCRHGSRLIALGLTRSRAALIGIHQSLSGGPARSRNALLNNGERRMRPRKIKMMARWLSRPRKWAKLVKRDVVALWIASRDPRTPLAAKVLAGAVAAYALSPVDLIPDFVPVIGYLDDLLIVPLGILLAIRLIPTPLMAEFRAAAMQKEGRPVSRTGLIAVVAIWIALAIGLIWLFWPTDFGA